MRAIPLVVAIMGPTASGKSRSALALARSIGRPCEIVSVDSAQVYRGMDLGTAKPSAAERAQVPHHLIDLIDPTETYSAARFRTDALAAIAAIHARGALPLLVGGTMLYFKALREGLGALPAADPDVRAAIDREAAARGWPALHAELAAVDPGTACRLAPNDAQRIQRALEIHRLTGRPMSAQLARDATTPDFETTQIALEPGDRSVLHAHIAKRFDAMLAAGLVDEVRRLRARYPALTLTSPAMRAVGYRQAWEHIDGRYGAAELRERGIAATRQLAKRQLTWLRSWPDVIRLDCFAADLEAQVHATVVQRIER